MSSTSTSHENAEIKQYILHNRMPPEMQLAGCTHSSTVMSEGTPGVPGGQQSQLLGHRFGFGYNHIYPYWGAYGGYGGYGGYGFGHYPYRGYRGYPWYLF